MSQQQPFRPNTPPDEALQALEMLVMTLFTYTARNNGKMPAPMFVDAMQEGIQSAFTIDGPLTNPSLVRIASHLHWLTGQAAARVQRDDT